MDKETWVLVVPIAFQDRRLQPSLDTTSQMLLELIPSIWPINKIVNMSIRLMAKLPVHKEILLQEPHPWIIILRMQPQIN